MHWKCSSDTNSVAKSPLAWGPLSCSLDWQSSKRNVGTKTHREHSVCGKMSWDAAFKFVKVLSLFPQQLEVIVQNSIKEYRGSWLLFKITYFYIMI